MNTPTTASRFSPSLTLQRLALALALLAPLAEPADNPLAILGEDARRRMRDLAGLRQIPKGVGKFKKRGLTRFGPEPLAELVAEELAIARRARPGP